MSAPVQHATVPKEHMHDPYRWIVADDAARLALSVLSIDVGKWLRQTGDNTTWELINDSPVEWANRGVPGGYGTAALEDVSETAAATKVPISDADGLIDDAWLHNRTFNTVAEMVADTDIKLGQTIGVYDYATGNNSGVLFFKAVAAGTGTADGGEYIDSVGVPTVQFQQNFLGEYSIKKFGAVDSADPTDYFDAAIKAAPKTSSNDRFNTLSCEIHVPEGNWTLTRLVNNDGCIPTFILAAGAKITNGIYLQGRLVKNGKKVNGLAQTSAEDAGGLSSRVTSGGYRSTNTRGLDDDGGTGSDDVVAFTAQVTSGDAALYYSGTVFTANTFTFTGVVNSLAENISVGAKLYVDTVPGYATITDISGTTVTVDAWTAAPDGGASVVPVNGENVYINHANKIWGVNVNTLSYSNVGLQSSVGQEIGQVTEQQTPPSGLAAVAALQPPYCWGYDAVMLGGGTGSVGHVARNDYIAGFAAMDTQYGFVTTDSAAARMVSGFVHRNSAGNAFVAEDPITGTKGLNLNRKGNATFGFGDSSETAITWNYRLKNSDRDFRISVTGGSAVTSEQATVTLSAASFDFKGVVRPASDNTWNLGQSAVRWMNVFSDKFRPGAGTAIWTSGSGSPEGVLTAVVGSMYTRTDGGAGTTLYIKESGTGNTGWVAK